MMNLSDVDILRLENYWNGYLNSAEQAEIEKRLKEDVAFYEAATEWRLIITEDFLPPKEEVEELAQIKKRLQGHSKEKITKEEKGFLKKNKDSIFVRRVLIGFGAAATVLLLFWLTPLSNTLWKQYPSNDFFAHLPRDNANLGNNTHLGRQAYDQQNYAKAYTALLEEVKAGGDSLNIIYAGVAAIGSGQAEKAIILLKPLVASDSWKLYRAEIQWYLALAYLDQEEITKAKEILKAIVQENEDYSKEANKLIEQMK